MEARGIRNCNPGNLRLSKDKWKGLRAEQTDKEFFQFEEMKWGYRALIRTLQSYKKKHGCETIAAMISRYAPETENATSAYIKSVCQALQVPSTYSVDVDDKDSMCALAAAISRVECGKSAVMSEVLEGWNLL